MPKISEFINSKMYSQLSTHLHIYSMKKFYKTFSKSIASYDKSIGDVKTIGCIF